MTMFYAVESGGVRTYLDAKAEWFATRSRIRHTIIAPASHGDVGRPSLISIPSTPIPRSPGFRLPLSHSMAARALHMLQPDLIEVGDPYQFAWIAARSGTALNVPLVAFYHSDLLEVIRQRFGHVAHVGAVKYARYLYRKFDMVLAPSAVTAQRLQDIGIAHVRHQPLGVDTSVFTPACRNAGLRRSLGVADNARLVVYAGRFSREKKLSLLTDAINRLGAPYHLLMIGSGTPVAVSPHITHLPFQRSNHALANLIASCDVLVHPGDQETFGLVVLEAMACGIPVVGVKAGGVAELVKGDTGLLVEPGCVDALAAGIRNIFDMGPQQLGANARRLVERQYAWNMIVPQLIGQYASLFAARKRADLAASVSYAID